MRRRRQPTRRWVLKTVALLPAATFAPAIMARSQAARRLRLANTHTGERLDVVYAERDRYLPDALREINWLLRDFRSGETHPIEPALLDLLCDVQGLADNDRPWEVVSGFRSPSTNELLRRQGQGVAVRSLHMQGRAIDVRLPGTATSRLRDIGLSLRAGGVGYYPKSDFVHLDTGRVRAW